ncbi:hypothetical protein BH11PSE8_BH11PSE8_13570 [soil metagenome]
MQTFPWNALLSALALGVVVLGCWAWRRSWHAAKKPAPLPSEWALSARPVFSTTERRIYRLLREAFPQHVVLSKLPLLRFCQPDDPANVRYWYELLGGSHVTFAVCSANGRVLAAIDLETERGRSRRGVQIKQSVLDACGVRYVRCPIQPMPTVAELQGFMPTSVAPARSAPRSAAATHDLHQARDTLASTVATRRAERTALWHDSTVFQDSFFAPDSRLDHLTGSDFGGLGGATSSGRMPLWDAGAPIGRGTPPPPDATLLETEPGDPASVHARTGASVDIAGVVIETPRASSNGRR